MGPIEKKIGEYMLSDGLSEETQMVLASLMKEIRPIEKNIINDSYYKGYSDKEYNRPLIWDQYSFNYKQYSFSRQVGELS
jgi:hypothetical protein